MKFKKKKTKIPPWITLTDREEKMRNQRFDWKVL